MFNSYEYFSVAKVQTFTPYSTRKHRMANANKNITWVQRSPKQTKNNGSTIGSKNLRWLHTRRQDHLTWGQNQRNILNRTFFYSPEKIIASKHSRSGMLWTCHMYPSKTRSKCSNWCCRYCIPHISFTVTSTRESTTHALWSPSGLSQFIYCLSTSIQLM